MNLMDKKIIRKQHTGQAGNGGEFGNHSRPDAEVTLSFRSQTDDQLAARHDPEPFLSDESRMTRAAYLTLPPAQRKTSWMLAPRAEKVPGRDPEPFARTYNGGQPKRITPEYAARSEDRFENNFGGIVTTRFSPRPEYARPPANTILSAVREWNAEVEPAWVLRRFLDAVTVDVIAPEAHREVVRDATPAERAHAAKVLTRLVNLA